MINVLAGVLAFAALKVVFLRIFAQEHVRTPPLPAQFYAEDGPVLIGSRDRRMDPPSLLSGNYRRAGRMQVMVLYGPKVKHRG